MTHWGVCYNQIICTNETITCHQSRKTTQKHLHSRANESMCTLRTNTKNLTCNKSRYSGENEYMKVLH
jgi:hypothetical protein